MPRAKGRKVRNLALASQLASLVRQVIVIPLLAVFIAGLVYVLDPSVPRYGTGRVGDDEVTLAKAEAHQQVLWVDARSQAEYNVSHLPGAVLLNEDAWSSQIVGFIQRWHGQPVVVYCDSARCNAARGVARRLKAEVGVEDPRVLHGGWETLIAAGRIPELRPRR